MLGTAKQLEASCEWASAATAYAQGADMLDNLAAGTSWRTISSRVSSGSDSSSSSSSSSAGIALDAKGRDIAAAQVKGVYGLGVRVMFPPAPFIFICPFSSSIGTLLGLNSLPCSLLSFFFLCICSLPRSQLFLCPQPRPSPPTPFFVSNRQHTSVRRLPRCTRRQ